MSLVRCTRLFAATLALATWAFAPAADAALPNPWPGGVHCTSKTGLRHTFRIGTNCRQFTFNGVDRRYVASVPLSAKRRMNRGERVPVVAMLHGSSGTGEQFLIHSGWREVARREGFIAVFPTGQEYLVDTQGPPHMSTKWADYSLDEDIDEAQTPPADDVGFLRSMAVDVAHSARVNPRRVYLSGFSNGGAMCMRAALELSSSLAAAGCNAGSLHSVHHVTTGAPHIPVVLTYGSLDDRFLGAINAAQDPADPPVTEIPMNPSRAFQLQGVSAVLSIQEESFDVTDQADVLFRGRNAFDVRFDEPVPGVTGTSQAQLSVLKGVEHEYPTATNNPHHFRMADLLWAFFRSHPQP
ncbi:MAG: polyhydroxybutyrate depolymerase [Solirubrobacteraceae bacterium]|nr:polyhydroxybutyrate depolymerase [Solirubrobacteraceae bacterium]